jgi:hypothetical protein
MTTNMVIWILIGMVSAWFNGFFARQLILNIWKW